MRHRSVAPILLVTILLSAMTASVVLSTLLPLRSSLPTAATSVGTVPLFNAWTIWWNADRAQHGFADYWNAPIFAGVDGTFAFSEPQPATLLVAPVYWATGSLILAYKTWLILALFLNGVFAYRLCRRIPVGRTAALAAGAMIVWLPLGIRHLDVLQLVPVWGILWTLDAAWQLCRHPDWKHAVPCGMAGGFCFWMSIHHGLLLAITIVPALLVAMPWRQVTIGWKSVTLAVVVAGAIAGPLVWPMRTIMHEQQFQRSESTVAGLSARPRDLVRLPPETRIGISGGHRGYQLSPGLIKGCLAVAGLTWGLRRHRRRRWTVYLATLAAVSATLALGPNLQIGSLEPWSIMTTIIPGLSQVRSVFRFAYLTQISVILLAAMGLFEIQLRLRSRFVKPIISRAVVVLLAAVCVLELPPPPLTVAGVPNLQKNAEWIAFVKRNSAADSAIACLPFAGGVTVRDFDLTTRWMYYGTAHGIPMVNGYSGFFPKSYYAMHAEFQRNGVSDDLLQQFAASGVHLIAIRRAYLDPAAVARLPVKRFVLKQVLADAVGIDIYELQQQATSHP